MNVDVKANCAGRGGGKSGLRRVESAYLGNVFTLFWHMADLLIFSIPLLYFYLTLFLLRMFLYEIFIVLCPSLNK